MIHWKSPARTGELVLKDFDPGQPRHYSVVLDLHGYKMGTAGGELEDAVSEAAFANAHLDCAGLAYRLRFTDRSASSTGFVTGDEAYHGAMRLLTVTEADGETNSGRP